MNGSIRFVFIAWRTNLAVCIGKTCDLPWKEVGFMQIEDVSEQEACVRPYTESSSLLPACSLALFYVFLATTVLAIFVPLAPTMPASGIDASYSYAMNEAVARHLSIGRDIVFTYGPYASICTRNYDPATDARTLWGSLLLALSYLCGALFLARGKKRWWLLLLFLFLATFGNNELVLLSYPFVLALCVVKETSPENLAASLAFSWPKLIAALVMWTTLGLLPLVKGSLLLPFAAAVAVCSAILAFRGRIWATLLMLIVPVASSLVLWMAAGQSVHDIPGFLHGTALLTSGYTEAMSTPWSVIPAAAGAGLVVIYVAISTLILLSTARSALIKGIPKVLLLLLYCVFLLVAFKHGFVGSSNISLAFTSLAVFLLLACLLSKEKALVWAFSIAVVVTTATSVIRDHTLIDQVHQQFGVGAAWTGPQKRAEILQFCIQRALPAYARRTYESTWNTYRSAWRGTESRLGFGESLKDQFAKANKTIRDEHPLPAFDGSADIYNYDQSVLLASGNKWDPRPVLQGYSAYTPELATMDEEHLRGSNAPDWIVFDLQTIVGRLPSLDDGMSWPAMLDNYDFTSSDGHYVFLHKKQTTLSRSNFVDVLDQRCAAGKTIILPETAGPLFAEIDLKPTLAGKLATAFLNPPQLWMVVYLKDGANKRFRVVAEMMETEFLLSPFVGDTKDFASFMKEHGTTQDAKKVRAISVAPAYGGSTYWSGTYELKLKRYVGQ